MANKAILNKLTFLSFTLADELFAISVKKVLEVLQEQEITEVPQTPEYITGIINFRGDILPVVDTRLKFNMTPRSEDDDRVIIILDLIVDDQKLLIGAIADGVKDVIEIPENDVKSAPEFGNNYNSEFLQGMIKIQEKFIMILDIDKVFSVEELNILQDTKDNGNS